MTYHFFSVKPFGQHIEPIPLSDSHVSAAARSLNEKIRVEPVDPRAAASARLFALPRQGSGIRGMLSEFHVDDCAIRVAHIDLHERAEPPGIGLISRIRTLLADESVQDAAMRGHAEGITGKVREIRDWLSGDRQDRPRQELALFMVLDSRIKDGLAIDPAPFFSNFLAAMPVSDPPALYSPRYLVTMKSGDLDVRQVLSNAAELPIRPGRMNVSGHQIGAHA